MRFTAPGAALHAALARCAKLANGRHIPILGTVHVVATVDAVTVFATDMAMGVRATVEGATVTTPGEACIPAVELTALAKAAGGMIVSIDHVLASAFAAFGRTKAELNTLPVIDFPLAKTAPVEMYDAPDLGVALRFVAPAIPTDDARYYLNGALVTAEGGETHVVASDGHRMHIAALSGNFGPDAIVPRDAVAIIAGMADEPGFRFGVSEREWCAEVGGVSARGALIDATYPDWRRVCPLAPQVVATVEASALVAALQTATMGSESRTRIVGVAIRDGSIAIRGASPGAALTGGVSTEIDAETTGAALRAGFNAGYVTDLAKALDCETLHLLTDSGDASFLIAEPAVAGAVRMIGHMLPYRMDVSALPSVEREAA